MQSGKPHDGDLADGLVAALPVFCGARTRKGGACHSYPVKGRRRGRMHGGATLKGMNHPNYKHGRRSKFCVFGWAERREEAKARALVGQLRCVNREVAKLPGSVTFEEFEAAVRRGTAKWLQRCAAARRPKPRRPRPLTDG